MNTKWTVLNLDYHTVIMPVEDIQPHGKKVGDNKYEINDGSATICECNPRIQTHGISPWKAIILLKKIIVTHQSFRDAKRIEDAMNQPKFIAKAPISDWKDARGSKGTI